MGDNKGAQLARGAFGRRGMKAALARAMKVGPGIISRWFNGDMKPSTPHRRTLETEHGIPWHLWDEEAKPERRKVFKGDAR